MTVRSLGVLMAAGLAASQGCGGASVARVSADSLIAEARTFMDGYARDLLAADAGAIAARYDTTGVYLLGAGRKEFLSHDSVAALYRNAPAVARPASFVWDDLSYEPIPPDAVVVVGKFTVGYPGINSTLSYSALLRRQAGRLRIRVEDESIDPAKVPKSWTDSTAAR